MSNTLALTQADSGKIFPLRAGVDRITIDFVPDNHFVVGFRTEDTGTYTITSTAVQFERIDGSLATNFTIGGARLLMAKFGFDTKRNAIVLVPGSNLTGQSSGGTGGSGVTGAVATATTLSYGTPATATASYANGVISFTFGLPSGKDGTNATGGATLPTPTQIGQVLTATGTSDGQYAWTMPATGTGTGSGTGTGTTPEVVMTPDANGNITLDAALGNSFRIVIDGAITMKNPTGYNPGDKLTIHFVRGSSGSTSQPSWDIDWGLPNRQPPVLPTGAGVINRLDCALTAGPAWTVLVTPDPSLYPLGYAPASFIARNVQRQTQYYVLRSGTVPAAQCGMTDMRPGETLKIIRNGLGIEAYGGLEGGVNGVGTYLITGAQESGNRAELRTGPGVRSAFDRGVLAFGDGITATVQDIILSGAREQSGVAHAAQGVSVTGSSKVTLKNVRLYDNENGLLSGNADYTGTLDIYDCEFDANGVGDVGLTHNIYMGQHPQGWTATRTTFKNAQQGHNIKSRAGITTLNQVLTQNAVTGRELNLPNGGKLYATDCTFHKFDGAAQNQLVGIGEEGIDTSRPSEYVFTRCLFQNDITGAGKSATFVVNYDTVKMTFIDCAFVGPVASTNSFSSSSEFPGLVGANGIVYNPSVPPVFINNSGVTPGPAATPGYQPIAVTQITG